MERQPRASWRVQGRGAADRLIIALDVPTLQGAARLIDVLAAEAVWFKIGSELFTAAGPRAVEMVLARERKVFLDLKFHDIPRTVAAAVAAAVRLGVAMMNVHVAAGEAALRAAVEAIHAGRPVTSHQSPVTMGVSRPLLLGVTRLTSVEDGPDTVPQVVEAATRAQQWGLDGVIASPREVAAIKAACGFQFVVVTPGIRPAGSPIGDQRRTATAAAAVRAGADYLVVGRPVLEARDPLAALRGIITEMDAVLDQGPEMSERKS